MRRRQRVLQHVHDGNVHVMVIGRRDLSGCTKCTTGEFNENDRRRRGFRCQVSGLAGKPLLRPSGFRFQGSRLRRCWSRRTGMSIRPPAA